GEHLRRLLHRGQRVQPALPVDVVVLLVASTLRVVRVDRRVVEDGPGAGDVTAQGRSVRPDQGDGTRHVRCGHGRPAELRIAVRRDAAPHVDTGGGDVRLGPPTEGRGPAAGERGDGVADVVGAHRVGLRVA